MDLNFVKAMINKLPDGPKKQEFLAKMETVLSKKKKSSGGGLHDEFELNPMGHIRIEEIDGLGNVVGVLADQPNLVVNGAEEILLRAFSGDPERILYKNRVPKSASAGPFYFPMLSGEDFSKVVNGVDQLQMNPNDLWKYVDDSQFDISYSYRPITVFVKQEASPVEPDKKTFKVYKSNTAGAIPLTSEVYSTYSNLFIGLGDGLHYDVKLSDARLTYTGTWTGDDARKETAAVGDSIKMKQKISNLVIVYEKSASGGQFEVLVNGVLHGGAAIETLDSGLTSPENANLTISGLDQEAETEVEIRFSGADGSVASPVFAITGLKWDALSKDMNKLIHEFENFKTAFDTTESYSTTTIAPYFIQLKHFPVEIDTVKISYEGIAYSKVNALADVIDDTFFVDDIHGKVYFNKALTNLDVAFHISGAIFDDESLASPTMVATSVNGVNAVKYKADHKISSVDKVFGFDSSNQSEEFTVITDETTFAIGNAILDTTDPDQKTLIIATHNVSGTSITKVEVVYHSDELPGLPTAYHRQVIERPKSAKLGYPWFQLDKGAITFVVEFPEDVPNHSVTIREMGLFDGPRIEDKIEGFKAYPVKAFSLVRIGEARKDASTGLRITWTITLLNENGQPFKGGL